MPPALKNLAASTPVPEPEAMLDKAPFALASAAELATR